MRIEISRAFVAQVEIYLKYITFYMQKSTWHGVEGTHARKLGQKLRARCTASKLMHLEVSIYSTWHIGTGPPPSRRRSPHQRLRSSAHLRHRLGLAVGDTLLSGRNLRRRRRRRGRRRRGRCRGSWRHAAAVRLRRRAGRRRGGVAHAAAAPSCATRGAACRAAHHGTELGRVDRSSLLRRRLVEDEALAPRLGLASVDFSWLHVEVAVINAGPESGR